jgi:hypothetical protein
MAAVRPFDDTASYWDYKEFDPRLGPFNNNLRHEGMEVVVHTARR